MADPTKKDDSFWDFTKLVPKKPRPTLMDFAPAAQPVDFHAAGGEESPAAKEARTLHYQTKTGETVTYTPADNILISRVTLENERSEYNFYHRFAEDAEALFDAEGPEVPYTPFYSYMPQYSQMNRAQSAYYLFWRGELLTGRPLKCDEGYLYLFIYETIHLAGSLLSPATALDRLLTLWIDYSRSFPKINKYLAEWVSDLCLIHRLPLPKEKLASLFPVIYRDAAFREFYFGEMREVTLAASDMLIALFSDYDPHASRYVREGGETADLFLEQIGKSMFSVFYEIFSEGKQTLGSAHTVTRSHPAYCGALYAKIDRYEVTVEYHPFGETSELREQVTAAVKYSENLLRAKLGMKSRLSVGDFPESYRRALDTYYRVIYDGPDKQKSAKKTEEPAYLALYDQAERGVDVARAGEIEALSWENTDLLVTDEIPVVAPMEAVFPPSQAAPKNDKTSEGERDTSLSVRSAAEPSHEDDALSRDALGYLRCLLEKRDASAYARVCDALAEEINQYFLESPLVGDIVLDPSDTGYILLSDYESEVASWMRDK